VFAAALAALIKTIACFALREVVDVCGDSRAIIVAKCTVTDYAECQVSEASNNRYYSVTAQNILIYNNSVVGANNVGPPYPVLFDISRLGRRRWSEILYYYSCSSRLCWKGNFPILAPTSPPL
jgi:hypothetical protein